MNVEAELEKQIADEILMLEPRWIESPHEVRDTAKFDRLVDSMKREGWGGRPLLVEHIESSAYMGWTGSHRIAAAMEAGIEEVPAYAVDAEALDAMAEAEPRWERDYYGLWAGAALDDWERVEMLRAAGDAPSAYLAEQEVVENELEDEG